MTYMLSIKQRIYPLNYFLFDACVGVIFFDEDIKYSDFQAESFISSVNDLCVLFLVRIECFL